MMSEFQIDLPQEGSASEKYAQAREWLGEDLNFPEIRARLLAQKTDPGLVDQIVFEVAGELVKPLVIGRVSSQVIHTRLAARGMAPDEVERVYKLVVSKHDRNLRSLGIDLSGRYGVGAIVITVGSVIYIGNITGFFPTVSGLGWITIIAGMLIFGWFTTFRR